MTPTMHRRARTLRDRGASLREIADALGVARTTVNRALTDDPQEPTGFVG
ncbi:hypothetical protein GCM10025868_46990 [Angustibacter aerolatus]|uniref:Transposase IS30-like HTH domain-containing protein n=1 Tax=Angustibacter aerolatus TaxID=1162965 RepID=A0ABQ6JQM6_9ACTN|nr:helix-turn-helix domain-containing protein [Angustibacter aerolatus]GMA89406.1 hypothetical protein GCM10025868_46560 [Angustibacter aerolatus]GMA89449.1 hypothetical protein GCM10025868_46990 [Angustibacter aerolatus]